MTLPPDHAARARGACCAGPAMKPIDLFGGAQRGRIVLPLGEPLTLGNMRANGVRSLFVSCWIRHHRAILSADLWPDAAFGPRMVCTRCRLVGTDARPNWKAKLTARA
jgi:hypothetical protein